MAFEEGHKKVGGRKKGTPNRNTKILRIALRQILENEIPNLEKYISKLENPKDKLEIIIKLMPFVFPKMKPTDLVMVDDSFDGEPPFNLF